MGIKMLMAITTLPATSHCASPRPNPPPPLAPKPNKNNAKLQKILKRVAKQQAAQTSLHPADESDKSHPYSAKPFRSSLSPVSEASPDLEHYERRSRSPRFPQSLKIPELPLPPYRQGPVIVTQTQHVASPYPVRKMFYMGKIEILPKIEISAPQPPAEHQNQSFKQLPWPTVPVKKFFIPSIQPVTKTQELPKVTVSPRFSPSFSTQRSWPGTEVSTADSITLKAPVPEAEITNFFAANGPNIAVTSPAVPVFESYRVKTPTNEPHQEKIANMTTPRAKTPTFEAMRAKTPTFEFSRAKTPTFEFSRAKTPTFEFSRAKTPTFEAPRAKTPTFEAPRAKTPTVEAPRAKTPTVEAPRAKTPTVEAPRAKTPTVEAPRAKTPTVEAPRAKTPTVEAPRAKTPTVEAPRAKTPTVEAPQFKTPSSEAPRETTLRNEVPQETLIKKVSNNLTVQNDALTVGISTVKIEINHSEMTTIQKSKAETEPRLPDSVAETTNQEGAKSFLKAEPQLKSLERAKPPRSKVSGWTRLKKHMVVEEEPPKFPEPEPEPSQSESQEQNQDKTEVGKQESQKAKGSRANKMWDAVLFQMFAGKERSAEESKQEQQESGADKSKQTQQATPMFSSRLPLLLFRPRFDARKLKEAAERPLKKISNTLIESGLHRKAIDAEELKDFNRTAKGWQT
ncbi:neurofilament heavy polypeptide [Heptranchias perlo]|uniref:neurofilament heavy polypeptide n=1 Tax=Heptranchias perlo TaxID=212740 RepID=UPI0035594B07